ncbi:MAG: nitrate/nitrite transporter [Clostridiaceae bacterium]
MSEISSNGKVQSASTFKWVMLLFVIVNAVFICGFALTSFAVLAPQYIIPEMGWTKMNYALIWGASPMGIMLTAFIGGVLFDKFKARYLMIIAVIAAGISVVLRAYLDGVTSFYALFLLIGIAQGLNNPGSIKVVTSWFPREQLATANGLLIAGSPIGMFSGFNLAIPFMNAVGGWRNMYLIFGVAICFLAVLWLLVAKDRSNQESELSKTLGSDTTETSVWENVKILLKTKQVWVICLSDFLFMGMILVYLGFGPTVFKSWPGVTSAQAGFLTSMANVGSLCGYIILPRIVDKLGIKKPFAVAGAIGTATFWIIGIMSGNYGLAVIMLILGGFCNGWAITMPRTMLQEHKAVAGQRSGTAVGMLMTCQRAGGVILPIVFTTFVASGLTNSVAISVIVGGAFISAVLLMMADETGHKKDKKAVIA